LDLKYSGLCLVAFIARLIPMRFGYFLAERGGDVLLLLSAKRRNNVSHNIQRALGRDQSKRELRQKTRYVFRNTAKNYFDLTKLARMNWDNLDGRVTIEGMHHLTRAIDEGKGVIIATAHLGNFEFGAHVIASQGIDMKILVEDYNYSPILRKIAALRRRNGVSILPVDIGGMKEVIHTLRRGGTVTIVCDRDIKGNGTPVAFFGENTSFSVGVVDLAHRTGAAVVPIFSLRQPDNTTKIYVESPLELSYDKNHDLALKANLICLVAVLEKYIRRYPDQWVVLEHI
jgi:phosphatidylinositol dimannoside acyltransferase